MEKETIFVGGLYLNRVSEKAPSFIITNQDIHVEKLIAWLTANKHLANERGYIKITGMESKTLDDKGFNKRYFAVDTYKPTVPQTTAPAYPVENLNPEDAPF